MNQQCECAPNHISDVGFSRSTPLAGYEPPWVKPDDPAWRQNLGYQVAGALGITVLAAIGLAVSRAARAMLPEAAPDWRSAQR